MRREPGGKRFLQSTGLRNCRMGLQPLGNHGRVVIEVQLTLLHSEFSAQPWQRLLEGDVATENLRTSGDLNLTPDIPKKISHLGNNAISLSSMGGDILPSDIGTKFLVPVRIPIKHETQLLKLSARTKFLSTQIHPEFERHVEPWKPRLLIQLCPRDVVNANPAFRDNLKNLLQTDLARIADFLRAPGDEAAIVNGKK